MNFDWINWEYVNDGVQIILLYLAIYGVLRAAKGSRFGQVLMGVGTLFGALIAFTYLFHFDVLTSIVRALLFYLALSTVVIFQPEIRRVLATIGAFLFADRKAITDLDERITAEKFTDILYELSKRKLGALIAFERSISLRGYETGVKLDALISPELIISIFTEPLPLHDGGLIIRNGRIASAHCLFPVSHNQKDLSASGMRHRAAVGLSEETDALVIIVSEETRLISIAHNGRILRYPDLGKATRAAIVRRIRKAMPTQKSSLEAFAEWWHKTALKQHDDVNNNSTEERT